MMRFLITVFGMCCLMCSGAFADNSSTAYSAWVPQSALVGEARLRVWWWDIYDAQLYAPQGKWQPLQPYALRLNYLRSFEGEAIAERSIEEIRNQGFKDEIVLARWYDLLSELLPDVDEQSRLTGVADAEQTTRFYFNGELIGTVAEPLFTQHFFAIWLGEGTSEPTMRAQLLGEQS